MKTLLTQSSMRGVALFVILLFFFTGCEKAPPVIIPPDDDASQTLIIKKGKTNPFSRDAFEAKLADDDYYAIMWVGHGKGEQSELPLPNHPGSTWGGTYNAVTVQMWSINDRQNFAFADLGTVQLGNTTIPVWTGALVKYEIGGELRELTYYYQLIQDENDDNPLFTGNNLFTISNSPDVQDVSVELNLPEKNIIMNVVKGQTVDPSQDWVIELKHPMLPDQDGLLIYERSDKLITNDWQNKFEGVSHLIIQVTEPATVLRIPSQDLQELRSNSSINLYTLELSPGPRIVARVPLLRHDGALNETLTIPSYQWHLVEFEFKE